MIEQLAAPARAVGGFVEMSIDTFIKIFRRPFQFREFLDQTWMIARVSLVPTLLVAIPFTVLVAFTLNILLREIGARVGTRPGLPRPDARASDVRLLAGTGVMLNSGRHRTLTPSRFTSTLILCGFPSRSSGSVRAAMSRA